MTALADLVRSAAQETAQAADGVARSDAVASNAAQNRALYVARTPIHPKRVRGDWRRRKWASLAAMLAAYYAVPWLRWDRGTGIPDQAVLADVAGGRIFVFGLTIWPQEVYFVAGLIVLSALGLFLATALFGRVWCGYACPQTVWTDLFIMVEGWIEGDRAARLRLDRARWTAGKIFKRGLKHTVWLAIAAATGGAFILYFHDAFDLARDFVAGQAPVSAYVFAGLLTFTTYALAGLMREQVCTYMCPWPRIQAALTDAESLAVTYRTDRGEPRGPHKKGQSFEERGHCIDCRQCVAACPMGIDIRDGAQLECINCALCIDACDEVMVKVGLPKGLIAYDTDLNIARRKAGEQARFRFVRPRTALYAVLIAALSTLLVYALAGKSSYELNVLRDRNPTFTRLSDGSIRNAFTLKLLNKTDATRSYDIRLAEAPAGAALTAVGIAPQDGALAVDGAPGEVRAIRVFVTVPAAPAESSMPLSFAVREAGGTTTLHRTVFLSGETNR